MTDDIDTIIDQALEIGAGCDWITPTLAMMAQGMTTVSVPDQYFDFVNQQCAAYGIGLHFAQLFGGYYTFSIRNDQHDLFCELMGWTS